METKPESCNKQFLSYQSTLTSLKENEKTETNGFKILCVRNVTAIDVSPSNV